MHRGLRLVAFTLDLMLALLTVIAWRLVSAGDATQARLPLFDAGAIGIVLLMLALRDVLLPMSPAKWLLCLRLTHPEGGPLPFSRRLLRAPFSLLPVALLPTAMQKAFWWRVTPDTPTGVGLVVRLAFTATVAAVSLGWAVHTFQSSIGEKDAQQLAHALVQGDERLRDSLGQPIQFDIGPIARRAEHLPPGTARFQLRLRGPQGLQEMQVLARKVDGSWAVEELTDIQIVSFRRGDADLAERR